jgi:glycopeptide antibiotics resistance protein
MRTRTGTAAIMESGPEQDDMTYPPPSEANPTTARRSLPAVSLAVYLALLLFLTLAPFDFTLRTLADGSLRGARVEWIPFTYMCPAAWYWCVYDRLVNLLGLCPFGALGALLPVQGASRTARALRLTGYAFGLSFSIEMAQLFLPSRFPSTADLLLNTIGAWIGAMVMGHARGTWAARLACAAGGSLASSSGAVRSRPVR